MGVALNRPSSQPACRTEGDGATISAQKMGYKWLESSLEPLLGARATLPMQLLSVANGENQIPVAGTVIQERET